MNEPWLKYADASPAPVAAQAGPWDKYAATTATPTQPPTSFGETLRVGAERFLKTPALPAIAGTVAGIATSGGLPLAGVPAAALAGGAGEAARQIGLRAVSSKQQNFLDQGNPDLPQTPGDAASEIAKQALAQGGAQLAGNVVGAVAKPVLGVLGKGAAAGAQGLTKIPAANFERIFANPSELFTAPLKSTIQKAYGKVGFLAEEGIDDAIKGATASDAALFKTGIKEIDKPFTQVDPQKILDARKAADSMLDQIKFFGGPKQARSAVTSRGTRVAQVRDYLNQALDTLAETGNKDAIALRQADALNASGAAANSFRSLVPRVNVMQSLPRAATAPLAVPAIAGGVTAAAGGIAKMAPFLGRAALGGGASALDMGSVLLDAMKKTRR